MIFSGFKIFFFFFTLTLFGWCTLTVTRLRLTFAVKSALAYGAGCFLVASQLFVYLFLFRATFNIYWFIFVLAVEFSLMIAALWRRGVIKKINLGAIWPAARSLKAMELIFLLLIVLQLVFSLNNALARPTMTYDSLAAWSFKAKALYYEKQISFNKDDSLYLGGGGHPNYPWLLPLVQFWFAEVSGSYDDLASNLVPWMFYLATLLLLYGLIRESGSRLMALAVTWLLASTPLFFYHSFNAYADLPLAFYILAASGFFYRWLDNNEQWALLGAGVSFGAAYLVKNEAVIFFLAALPLLVSLVWRRRCPWKQAGLFLITFAAAAAPWLVFQLWHGLSLQNTPGAGLGFHSKAILPLVDNFFWIGSWNVWWFIVVGVLAIYFKNIYRDSGLSAIWLLLVFTLGGFVAMYIFTEQYLYAVDFTASGRNTLAVLPFSMLVVATTFAKALPAVNKNL